MKKYLFSTILLALFAIGFTASEDPVEGEETASISLLIQKPTANASYITSATEVTISGVAAASNGLESITFKTNTGLEGVAEGLDNWEIANLPLVEGENIIEVVAHDQKGLYKTAKLTITQGENLAFLEVPTVSNELVFTNELTDEWITAKLSPTVNLTEETLKLIQVDENDNVLWELGTLWDDGDLENHGDEIKGDRVFSMKGVFQFAEAGTKYFRVVATVGGTEIKSPVFTINVFDKDDAENKLTALIDYKNTIETQLKVLTDPENHFTPAQVKAAILVWLAEQQFIVSTEDYGDFIKVNYINGLSSFIFVEANKGYIKGGGVPERGKTPAIALDLQTRGIWQQPSTFKGGAFKAPSMDNIIQNKNVLIWSPFENNFAEDMEPVLAPIFANSPLGFGVTYLKNEQCDVASLQNIGSYGVVILDTHGFLGNMLITRQRIDDLASLGKADQYKDYLYQYINGNMFFVTMAYYCEDLLGNAVETFFAVTPQFFTEKIKTVMPNSIIFNGSCESSMGDAFADAFFSKGAKAYLGFSNDITVTTCNKKAVEFFTTLTSDVEKTTGDAYIPDLNFNESCEGASWTTSYLMSGSTSMHFTLGLINGDFEFGNMNGWGVDGDGRVITQLGFLKPTQGNYMGIISTGLGYTTAHGTIFQSFRVANETTLTLDWNFLSEEFLEYIGSIYQDYFIISIIAEGGEEEILFSKSIDEIAADFGAANGVAGNLISVSPDIVFDRGGVYMTGWQTTTIDISKYQGKNVTLFFKAHDIGDSIYDTAILLDQIAVY